MHYRNRSKPKPKGPKPINTEGAKRGARIDAMALAAKSKDVATAKRAKTELFTAIQPMMLNIARIHSRRNGMPQDDVFQDASIGFLRAVELWNPKAGANFLTYVGNWLHALANRAGMRNRNGTNKRDPNRLHASFDAPVSHVDEGSTQDTLYDLHGVDADQDAHWRKKREREDRLLKEAVERVEAAKSIQPRKAPPRPPGSFGGRALVEKVA